MKHNLNSFLKFIWSSLKVSISIYQLTIVSFSFAQTSSYIAIIGGSTKDDNKEHYHEQAKSIYEVLKTRSKEGNLIYAFSSGPGQSEPEGVKFNYEAFYNREYAGQVTRSKPMGPLSLIKFDKDFNGDGKEDVQFSGKYDDIRSSIKVAVSKLKESDSLNVMIGNHGSMGFDLNVESIFDTQNAIVPYAPFTMSELDLNNLKYASYEEIYSWIDSELQKKGLQKKVQIKMNAHNCFGGGVVGLTKYNVCATATNTGTQLSSGIPDPYKIPPPPSPLADLRLYEFGGYWHFYYKHLKDNPEASQMDAYWYSVFRDLVNTPVSSLDYVLEKYLKRIGRGEEFQDVFERMGNQRFQKKSKTSFEDEISCLKQNTEMLNEHITALGLIVDKFPITKDRKLLINKYEKLYQSYKKSEDYLFLEKEQKRLLKEAGELRAKLINKYQLGNDFFNLDFRGRGEKKREIFSKFLIPNQSEITKSRNNTFFNNDPSFAYMETEEYKTFKKELFILNKMSEQAWIIKKQEEQVSARFKLYLDFIKNSNQEELKLFKDMEKCLESKF